MTAAAFLYNLTGETKFEKIISTESEVENATSRVRNPGGWQQQFAAIAYLFTPRKANFPELQKNMKEAIINQAKNDYLATMDESPTKAARWTGKWEETAQTSSKMSLVAIAHKLTDYKKERDYCPTAKLQRSGHSDRKLYFTDTCTA